MQEETPFYPACSPEAVQTVGWRIYPRLLTPRLFTLGRLTNPCKLVTQLQNRANVTSCVRMEWNDTCGLQHSAGHRGRALPKLETTTMGVVLVLPLEEKGLFSSLFFKTVCFPNIQSYIHLYKPNTNSGNSPYLFYQVLFQFQAFLGSFG